jgi:hypothetical protein
MAIGKLFHIIHMTGDLPALEAWYDDVFSVRRGFLDHHYMEGEKRDASLVVLGDCVIEPLSPAFGVEGWDVMPLGRFYQRFGNHWHSIAWYTDDAGEIWQRCTDNGVRVYVEGGVRTTERPSPQAAIMTHPKDTIAQLEFMNPVGTLMEDMDPRLKPGWDPNWWADNHPLGLVGLAYDDMAANGQIHHAAAFRVKDLDQAEEYLKSKGIEPLARDDSTLLTRPDTTHGVPFRWTTSGIPS